MSGSGRIPVACDVLIIGSGIAGLVAALKLSAQAHVVIVTKRSATEASTRYAQGGIASVMDEQDSYARHIDDTLQAGAGLSRPSVAEIVVRDGPRMIRQLIDWGVRFSGGSELDLGREGGHTANRIVHFKDMTGHEVERALHAAVLHAANISVLEDLVAVNLLGGRRATSQGNAESRVHGAYVLDTRTGNIGPIAARATILATGGCGKAYLYTSNPDVATGDGIAMAFRAGARVADMEFVQFHPTCLYDPAGSRFLISEAVRGEGAILRNAAGDAFMARYDARLELAPRDVVARAIDQEMKQRGDKCVFLDVRHLPEAFLRERFPTIHDACAHAGIDMAHHLVPVVPAAHYMCGGVLVDVFGRTDLPNLYAVGETACTGLHGANRLASNSLLEALVFADRAAADVLERGVLQQPLPPVQPWTSDWTTSRYETVILDHDWDQVRRVLWDHVGIVRSDERLEIAAERLGLLRRAVEGYYWRYALSADLVELRNLALVAELIVRCARFRKESRGLHFNLNWPDVRDAFCGDTVLSRFEPPRLLPFEEAIETVRS